MALLAIFVQFAALSWVALSEEDFSYDNFDGVDRYIRFDDHPKPKDKERAILGGRDAKCGVCEVILNDVMGAVRRSSDVDEILEALEADNIQEEDIEKAPTDMLKHVAKKKRGCNKLFKDNFFAKGWEIVWDVKLAEGQTEQLEIFKKATWAYARHTGKVPNATEMNTYSINREIAHYACENTVAKYRDELARFLAKKAKRAPGEAMKELTAEACRRKAKCEVRGASESPEARSEQAAKAYFGRAQDTLEMVKADQKAEKKAAKQAEKAAKKEAKRKAADAKKRKAKDTVEL